MDSIPVPTTTPLPSSSSSSSTSASSVLPVPVGNAQNSFRIDFNVDIENGTIHATNSQPISATEANIVPQGIILNSTLLSSHLIAEPSAISVKPENVPIKLENESCVPMDSSGINFLPAAVPQTDQNAVPSQMAAPIPLVKTQPSPKLSVRKDAAKPAIFPVTKSEENIDSIARMQIQTYMRSVSGQAIEKPQCEVEHNYAKPIHAHPDSAVHALPTRFLFMKNFPYHEQKTNDINGDADSIDVESYEEVKKIPFLTPKPNSAPTHVDENSIEIDPSITNTWSCEKTKLWTKATKIIYADRISRATFERNNNEMLLTRNLQDQTSNKFRELFSSLFWDKTMISWLHETLLKYLEPVYQTIYLDSLQNLKLKIPSLIDTFYVPSKLDNRNRTYLSDPLFNTLSHYKPVTLMIVFLIFLFQFVHLFVEKTS